MKIDTQEATGHNWEMCTDDIFQWQCIKCGTFHRGHDKPSRHIQVVCMAPDIMPGKKLTCEEVQAWKVIEA